MVLEAEMAAGQSAQVVGSKLGLRSRDRSFPSTIGTPSPRLLLLGLRCLGGRTTPSLSRHDIDWTTCNLGSPRLTAPQTRGLLLASQRDTPHRLGLDPLGKKKYMHGPTSQVFLYPPPPSSSIRILALKIASRGEKCWRALLVLLLK